MCYLRNNYESRIAIDAKHNPKALWRYNNSKVKFKLTIPTLVKVSSEALSDAEKATSLNNFFSCVAFC